MWIFKVSFSDVLKVKPNCTYKRLAHNSITSSTPTAHLCSRSRCCHCSRSVFRCTPPSSAQNTWRRPSHNGTGRICTVRPHQFRRIR